MNRTVTVDVAVLFCVYDGYRTESVVTSNL